MPFLSKGLLVIFYKSVHGLLQDIPQLELVRLTQLPDHIPETVGHAPYKMDRQFPAFPELTQMLEEKIVQPVLDDVLDHIVPAVLHQEKGKRSEIPVGEMLFVHVLQNLLPV